MRVLVIRFSSLGDILLTIPCVFLLREEYPKASIVFATKQTFSELLVAHNDIDQVLCLYRNESIFSFAKRLNNDGKFDLIIDLHNSLRSQILRLFLSKKKTLIYKKPYFKRWLLVFFKINRLPQNESVAFRYMKTLQPLGIQSRFIQSSFLRQTLNKTPKVITESKKKIMIAIAPGSRWYTKMWPLEGFLTVTKTLLARKHDDSIIIFLGGSEERYLGEKIEKEFVDELGKRVYNFIGTLSLLETSSVLSHARVLLCNDSGLMHMASALKVRVLPLFLSTVPEFGFLPIGLSLEDIISHPLGCKPCDHKGLKKCPQKHFHCAQLIRPEEVSQRLIKLLP